MLKLKVKVLVSLVLVVLVAMVVGNVVSLATEPTVTIQPTTNNVGVTITSGNTNSNTNKNSNTNSAVSATVGATNNAAKNTNKVNTNSNTNKNTNTNKAAKLPYAGADSSVAVVVVALAASAIYAYKKVSDYNI